MGTIGQTFKEARERMGVTTNDAANITHIKVQHIENMEMDDFSHIAAPAYAKGFIKMYAEYLGLDARPLLEEYAACYLVKPSRSSLIPEQPPRQQVAAQPPPPKPQPKKPVPPSKNSNKVLISKRSIVIAAAAVAVLLIVFVVFQFAGRQNTETTIETKGTASLPTKSPSHQKPILTAQSDIYLEHATKGAAK